jgi:integrase
MVRSTDWPTGIRPSGRGFQIRVWRQDKPAYTETFGCSTNKTDLAGAIKRRDWLKVRISAGLPIIEGEDSALSLFGEVAQDYLETFEGKQSSLVEYHRILNHWWMVFANDPIQHITKAQIKRILKNMDVTTRTKRNRLIPLYGVFNHAEIRPPIIKLKKHQKKAIERYTPIQREALLERMDGQARVYFAILFGCGLRPGECLGLEWSDFDGEYLHISKQITKRRLEPSTKTSVRRKVYVPKTLRGIIQGCSTRFAGGHIFQNSFGRPYLDTDIFNAEWKIAHKKARIPYRIPYVCRHTRAAELLSMGVAPARAAKELGHSVEMFLRTYSEYIEEYAKEDMSLFESVDRKNTAENKEGQK